MDPFVCLGCGSGIDEPPMSTLPLLLHGKFCAPCAAKLGFAAPDAPEEHDDESVDRTEQ